MIRGLLFFLREGFYARLFAMQAELYRVEQ